MKKFTKILENTSKTSDSLRSKVCISNLKTVYFCSKVPNISHVNGEGCSCLSGLGESWVVLVLPVMGDACPILGGLPHWPLSFGGIPH